MKIWAAISHAVFWAIWNVVNSIISQNGEGGGGSTLKIYHIFLGFRANFCKGLKDSVCIHFCLTFSCSSYLKKIHTL